MRKTQETFEVAGLRQRPPQKQYKGATAEETGPSQRLCGSRCESGTFKGERHSVSNSGLHTHVYIHGCVPCSRTCTHTASCTPLCSVTYIGKLS